MRRLAIALAALAAGSLLPAAVSAPGVAEKRLEVGLVLQAGGPTDPYHRISVAGFRRAVRDIGVQGRILTAGPREGLFPSLAYFARQRYDLVIALGSLNVQAYDAAAVSFPKTRFAIVDASHEALPHKPRNVEGTVFRTEEAAYLAGYLAALLERQRPGKDVVSSVGGVKISTVDAYIGGYQAGARKASPRITTLNGYSNDFLDQEKCKRVALNQIAKGSGVVFPVAGGCSFGALDAAKRRGVWGIGVDADYAFLGAHMLTSVVKRMDVAVYEIIRRLAKGSLPTGGDLTFDLRNDGVGLGTISPKVPRALVAQVERIRRQIISGKIRNIPTTVP